MATATAITIKKNDGTTDIVYAVVAASGGDKSPAVFRSTTAPGTPGQQPELRIWTAQNASNTSRKLVAEYSYPKVYTDSTTSLTKVLTRANLRVEGVLPLEMDAATANEFGAQFGNLMAAALVKGVFQGGYAPT